MSRPSPVAIVTGGSGGLAPGIVTALAADGFLVVITARRAGPLAEAAEKAGAAGKVVPIVGDVRDAASVRMLIDEVVGRFGQIDVLVNAAASSTPIGGAIEQIDVAALIADLDVKVGGYLRMIQAVAPVMKAQRHGRIINIGGLTGRSSDTVSGLRNAAVSHLTKVLSDQLAGHGIAVNAVHPGMVRSPHLTELMGELAHELGCSPAEVEQDLISQVPAQDLLVPEDLGRIVLFLARLDPRLINGQSVTVDGGFSRGVFL